MELLFPQYSYDTDSFFQERLFSMSEDELLELETMFMDIPMNLMSRQEVLARRITHSKFFTNGENLDKIDIVCLLMLHVPYITVKGLQMLKIFDNKDNIYKFLAYNTYSEKNKKGKFRAFNLSGNKVRKAYTLTSCGRQHILDMLPPKYISSGIIISEKSTAGQSMHDSMCCNLYHKLISDTWFPYFNWYSTPFFSDEKDFRENIGTLNSIPDKDESGLKPDAFIQTLGEIATYIYLEQDLCTERTAYLTEKIKKYQDFFSQQGISTCSVSTLLFSIYTDADTKGKRIKNRINSDGTATKMQRIYKELKLFHGTMTATKGSNVTIHDMISQLHKLIKSASSSEVSSTLNSYRLMYALLNNILRNNPNARDFEDVGQHVKNHIDARNHNRDIAHCDISQKVYEKRYQTLLEIVDTLPEFQAQLRKGLKFIVKDTFELDDLNTSMLYEYKSEILTKKLLPTAKRTLGDITLTFSTETALLVDDDLLLCNHCKCNENNSVHLVFENISADIGALYRLKTFVQRYDRFSGSNEQLFIYILVSTIQDAIKFNESTHENETIVERYCNPSTATRAKANIMFMYLCYEEKDGLKKPFVIEQNGDIMYI